MPPFHICLLDHMLYTFVVIMHLLMLKYKYFSKMKCVCYVSLFNLSAKRILVIQQDTDVLPTYIPIERSEPFNMCLHIRSYTVLIC